VKLGKRVEVKFDLTPVLARNCTPFRGPAAASPKHLAANRQGLIVPGETVPHDPTFLRRTKHKKENQIREYIAKTGAAG
jgi:hypothetical protein